jgi:uncharacterized protein with HEPN domain
MSRDDPQVRLRHRLAYASSAVALMRYRRHRDLDIDRALGVAVLRCLEILGEAANRNPCRYPTTLSKDPVATSHWHAKSAGPRL